MADQYYSLSGTYTNNGIADIIGTTDDELYKSERYGVGFGYALPVENGDYDVDLHFAEIYFGSAVASVGVNERVFDVTIEDNLVIDNLDIYDTVGAETALVITVPVSVTDGQLNIDFISEINQAKVSAIQLRPSEQVCEVPQNLSAVPSAHGAYITWDAVPNAFGYHLRGRKLGRPTWKNKPVGGTSFSVGSLPSATTFEVEVRAGCPTDTSEFTATYTFTTLSPREGKVLLSGVDLSPNPATNNTMLRFDAEQSALFTIHLVDMTGRVVREYLTEAVSGQNQVQLDLNGLTDGIYLIRLNHEEAQQTIKLTVSR
jgi:hypothetical protein